MHDAEAVVEREICIKPPPKLLIEGFRAVGVGDAGAQAGISRQNDDPAGIRSREFQQVIYGDTSQDGIWYAGCNLNDPGCRKPEPYAAFTESVSPSFLAPSNASSSPSIPLYGRTTPKQSTTGPWTAARSGG